MKRLKTLGLGIIMLFVAISLLSVWAREFPKTASEKIFVTDGPVTSISFEKSSFKLFEMMEIGFDKRTILYDGSGRPIPIQNLKINEYVTVIFTGEPGQSLAKEIYLHKDGRIGLSKQGRIYFEKAGITVGPGPIPGEEKKMIKNLCH